MKFFITAHPIDREHQEVIGIYYSGYVPSPSVGRVLKSLVAAGHTTVDCYFEPARDELTIHCSKKPRG